MNETKSTGLTDYEAAWWGNRLWEDLPEDAKERLRKSKQ